MRVKLIASLAFAAAALTATSAAQAAPAGSVMGALRDDAAPAGVIEKATYGYGWWHHRYGWHPYGYKRHYGWKPHSYGYHYGWRPHYGWTPHYGNYRHRYGGYYGH